MESVGIKKRNDLDSMMCFIKMASLIFSMIVIYSGYSNEKKVDETTYKPLLIMLLSSSLAMLLYWLWITYRNKLFHNKYEKILLFMENLIFIIFYSYLIYITDVNYNQYKLIYLIVIISSVIQMGYNSGIYTACISGGIILSMDLLLIPYEDINITFQNDLILVGIFIIIAWYLGSYVRVEQENFHEKKCEVEVLSSQLEIRENERILFEKELIKNTACYKLLIRKSPDPIIIHSYGKIMYVNEAACQFLGYEAYNDLLGKDISDFVPESFREKLPENYVVKNDGKVRSFECKILRKSGKIADVVSTYSFFNYEGQSAVLNILSDKTYEKYSLDLERDIEEKDKLLIASKELNKITTEFFSNISHELKTPLNVIFTALQMMDINNGCNDKQELARIKYLRVMKQNCYRLMRLLNNLIDMSRIDSGFLKLQMKNRNIVALIEDIVQSVATYVEDKKLNIVFDTDVEERIIACDSDKMERIILNLISNSIKFTDTGGSIYVNIYDGTESITISIRDTGTGIPREKLGEIFNRFSQVDKTFTRNREGSGIGLSLVKSLVEMHDGSIEAKSELGQGSEFIITLPAVVLDHEDEVEDFTFEPNIYRINVEFSDIYSD